MNDKVAFVVLSCDKYMDLWPLFVDCFNTFWPDCPYDKYFVSNTKTLSITGFKQILVGVDETWSIGLKKLLNVLREDYKYMLITLEDLFLCDNVDNNKVVSAIDSFIKADGTYLRLNSHNRKPDIQYNELFGRIRQDAVYRNNCVYAVWNIDRLYSLLRDNENAWEFERIGVERTRDNTGYYMVNNNLIRSLNVVVKGRMLRREWRIVKRIIPNAGRERKMMPLFDEVRLQFKRRLIGILHHTPLLEIMLAKLNRKQ